MAEVIIGIIVGGVITLFLWPYYSLLHLKSIADDLETIADELKKIAKKDDKP